jgi:hypothetical protein
MPMPHQVDMKLEMPWVYWDLPMDLVLMPEQL